MVQGRHVVVLGEGGLGEKFDLDVLASMSTSQLFVANSSLLWDDDRHIILLTTDFPTICSSLRLSGYSFWLAAESGWVLVVRV